MFAEADPSALQFAARLGFTVICQAYVTVSPACVVAGV
jgi:hypothetical protein